MKEIKALSNLIWQFTAHLICQHTIFFITLRVKVIKNCCQLNIFNLHIGVRRTPMTLRQIELYIYTAINFAAGPPNKDSTTSRQQRILYFASELFRLILDNVFRSFISSANSYFNWRQPLSRVYVWCAILAGQTLGPSSNQSLIEMYCFVTVNIFVLTAKFSINKNCGSFQKNDSIVYVCFTVWSYRRNNGNIK